MANKDIEVGLRLTMKKDGSFDAKISNTDKRIKNLNTTANQSNKGFKNMARTMKDTARQSMRLGNVFFNLKTAITGLGVVMLNKALLDSQIQLERTEVLFKSVFGKNGSAKEMEYAKRVADELGLSVLSVYKGYAKLSAATMKMPELRGENTKEIFEGIQVLASAMKLTAEDQFGILRAVEQSISKGTVMAEELKLQLGDRIPGALDMAARSMDMTTSQLLKAMEKGELKSNQFWLKFARTAKEQYADAARQSSQSNVAAIERLKNAWQEAVKTMMSSGMLDTWGDAIREVTKAVKSEDFKQAMVGYADLFKSVIGLAMDLGKWLTQSDVMATLKEFAKTGTKLAGAYAGMKIGATGGSVAGPWGAIGGGTLGFAAGYFGVDALWGNGPRTEQQELAGIKQQRDYYQGELDKSKKRLADINSKIDRQPRLAQKFQLEKKNLETNILLWKQYITQLDTAKNKFQQISQSKKSTITMSQWGKNSVLETRNTTTPKVKNDEPYSLIKSEMFRRQRWNGFKIPLNPHANDNENRKLGYWSEDVRQSMLSVPTEQTDIFNSMQSGMQSWLDNSKDMFQQFAQLATGAIQKFEDALVSGLMNGRFEFKSFANYAVSELLRIAMRQHAIRPLVSGLSGMMGDFSSMFGNNASPPMHYQTGQQKFANGGLISGAGSARSDGIFGWMSNLEFVVNARATAKHLPLLQAINNGTFKGFANGGHVGGRTATMGFAPVFNVNVHDNTGGAVQYHKQNPVQRPDGGFDLEVVAEFVEGIMTEKAANGESPYADELSRQGGFGLTAGAI